MTKVVHLHHADGDIYKIDVVQGPMVYIEVTSRFKFDGIYEKQYSGQINGVTNYYYELKPRGFVLPSGYAIQDIDDCAVPFAGGILAGLNPHPGYTGGALTNGLSGGQANTPTYNKAPHWVPVDESDWSKSLNNNALDLRSKNKECTCPTSMLGSGHESHCPYLRK